VVELSTIYNYPVEVEGQLQDGFIDHWAAGSQMNRTVVRGVPRVLPALQNPAKVIHNLIHRLCVALWMAGNAVGRGADGYPS